MENNGNSPCEISAASTIRWRFDDVSKVFSFFESIPVIISKIESMTEGQWQCGPRCRGPK